MARMAAQPMQMHRMPPQLGQQFLPEVHVFDRLFVRLDPVFLLPGPEPAFFHRIADVLRIRIKLHRAGFPERGQGFQHAGDLHAVVGGQAEAARQFLAVIRAFQAEHGGPSAGAGIAQAGAVGMNNDLLHRLFVSLLLR